MAKNRKPPAEEIEPSCVIQVQVIPRSSRIAIESLGDLQYKIKLTSPPVDGAANKQLIEVVSDKLAVPRRNVEILSGETGRRKRIRVVGADRTTVTKRLAS